MEVSAGAAQTPPAARGISKLQRIICYSLLLLGLSFAAWSASLRIASDKDYKEVLLLVDWQGLAGLPETDSEDDQHSSPQARWRLLERIPGAQICYGEETLGQLVREGVVRLSREPQDAPHYEVADPRYIDDVEAGCERHGYWHERDGHTQGRLLFELPALGQEALNNLPVCWRREVIDAAKAHGVGIILRPDGSEYLGPQGLEKTLAYCGEQRLMLFQGSRVLGFPGRLEDTARTIRDNKQYFGWVEFDEQDGGEQLASKLAPKILRVHSITSDEMEKYSIADAVQRYYRAVSERGVRVVYLRPYVSGPLLAESSEFLGQHGDVLESGYRTKLYELNQQYFGSIFDMLQAAGYQLGAGAGSPHDAPPLLKKLRPLFFVLAKGGVFVLLLALWFPLLPRWAYSAVLGLVGLKAVAAMLIPGLMSIFLLETAIIFPLWAFFGSLSLYQRVARERPAWCPRRLLAALGCLLLACLISAAGGLLIHGAMWDSRMMLHVGQFKGITLGLAAPILLLAAWAWQAESLQDAWDSAGRRLTDYWTRLSSLWTAPIRYGDVAFILIAVGAIGVVLLRSGNEGGLPVLDAETLFRGSLEQVFTVRPRTKELLGHPALLLFFLSLPWRNRLSLLLALGGMLGQVSILNTFCHIHTPLAITLQRVGLGIFIGLMTGLAWGILVQLIAWGAAQLRRRFSPPTSNQAA